MPSIVGKPVAGLHRWKRGTAFAHIVGYKHIYIAHQQKYLVYHQNLTSKEQVKLSNVL